MKTTEEAKGHAEVFELLMIMIMAGRLPSILGG